MQRFESDKEYLESWSEELTAKANRVRQLIGNKHWLTDGHHKEVIVREFLCRYLPTTLEIGSGFIKYPKGCSTEIDVLISDYSRHPAFFNEGGIQILPPSSVVAYIEMKSTYKPAVLTKALKAISKIQQGLTCTEKEIWRCICFATIDSSFEEFHKTVIAQIENHIVMICKKSEGAMIISQLPTCIASFESYIVFIREDTIKNSITLNFFDFGRLSISIAFSDLFEEIRSHFGNNNEGELSALLMDIPNNNYFKYEININD